MIFQLNALKVLAIASTVYVLFLDLPKTKYLIASTYVYSAIWTVPPLFGWGKYSLEPSMLSCSVAWYDLSTSYFVAIMFGGYVVPLGIIAYSYIRIWIFLRRTAAQAECRLNTSTARSVSMSKVSKYWLNLKPISCHSIYS